MSLYLIHRNEGAQTISKSEFMSRYQLFDDTSCCIDKHGHPISRMEFHPLEYGFPILNGQTLELEIDESVKSIFAVTVDGLLSNEIVLNPQLTSYQIVVSTKGGGELHMLQFLL